MSTKVPQHIEYQGQRYVLASREGKREEWAANKASEKGMTHEELVNGNPFHNHPDNPFIPKKEKAALGGGNKQTSTGPRGGKIIGKTKSGKPIYAPSKAMRAGAIRTFAPKVESALKKEHLAKHPGFTSQDHEEASHLHYTLARKLRKAGDNVTGGVRNYQDLASSDKAKLKRLRSKEAAHRLASDFHDTHTFMHGAGRR
jgi:hypothetical protein